MVDDDYTPDTEEADDVEDEEKADGDKQQINGILINMCYPLTDSKEKLKENDVLLQIDGVDIGGLL